MGQRVRGKYPAFPGNGKGWLVPQRHERRREAGYGAH